jgi:hypothetical protein
VVLVVLMLVLPGLPLVLRIIVAVAAGSLGSALLERRHERT